MIRITNPGDDFKSLKDPALYRDVLEIRFYDFTEETHGLAVFDETVMMRLVEFFKKHKDCHNMAIHCDLGVSRSAGVAVGWLLFKDDRSSIYKIYHGKKHMPNSLIVTMFSTLFKRGQKYLKKWADEQRALLTQDME
jgi:predicted protein tyrosine phosphatase